MFCLMVLCSDGPQIARSRAAVIGAGFEDLLARPSAGCAVMAAVAGTEWEAKGLSLLPAEGSSANAESRTAGSDAELKGLRSPGTSRG